MRHQTGFSPVGKPRGVSPSLRMPFPRHRDMQQVIDDEKKLAKDAHPTKTKWNDDPTVIA